MPLDWTNIDRDKIVIIIGAGPAGLVSARWALAHGLTPIIFEKSIAIGGLWNKQYGGTWPTMHTNLSKFTCMFSDLVWDEDAPLFPSATEMHEYLYDYANKYNLQDYIFFDTDVINIDRANHKWQLTARSTVPNRTYNFTVKNVIVATGYFSQNDLPDIVGLDTFKSTTDKEVLHSAEFRYKPSGYFAGKKVVVVGCGFSGAEIAAELANAQAEVVHIVDNPHWVIPRNLPLPIDLVFYRRATRKTDQEVRIKSAEENLEAHQYVGKFSPQQKDPAHPLHIAASTNPVFVAVSDDYMSLVEQNKIKIQRGRISAFTAEGYKLQSDAPATSADVVIFCTGYKTKLPFAAQLAQRLNFNPDDKLQSALLYKGMLHPNLPNMAFVGMYRGPYFAIMELQARWAAMILSKQVRVSTAKMRFGMLVEKALRQVKNKPQFPHGDYVGFADSLAKLIGCLPDFAQLKTADPDLHRQLFQGPALPTHYRVTGPHANRELFTKQFRQVHNVISNIDPKHPCLDKTSMLWRYRKLAPIAFAVATVGVAYAANTWYRRKKAVI